MLILTNKTSDAFPSPAQRRMQFRIQDQPRDAKVPPPLPNLQDLLTPTTQKDVKIIHTQAARQLTTRFYSSCNCKVWVVQQSIHSFEIGNYCWPVPFLICGGGGAGVIFSFHGDFNSNKFRCANVSLEHPVSVHKKEVNVYIELFLPNYIPYLYISFV